MGKKTLFFVGGICCLWLIGLCLFAVYAFSIRPWSVEREAIVVLTGGVSRIPVALRLLEEGKSQKLFISGVHDKVSIDALLNKKQSDLKDKITLGYQAVNTFGNALETMEWLRKNNLRSILLVTSFYHMPRSLLELKEQMPELSVAPYPVFPEKKGLSFLKTKNAWFLFTEYNKFIVVWIRKGLKSLFRSIE